jgi:ribosome-associated protein
VCGPCRPSPWSDSKPLPSVHTHPGYHISVTKAPDHAPDQGAQTPSKTQRKRQMHALQALGEQLVALSAERLRAIALPPALRDAVEQAQGIKAHEGRRRQLQYIGKLMRAVDAAPIEQALLELTEGSRQATQLHHAAEQWRSRLLAQPELIDQWPVPLQAARREQLLAALAAARAELAAGAPGRRYRELFRRVREALSATQPSDADGALPSSDNDHDA